MFNGPAINWPIPPPAIPLKHCITPPTTPSHPSIKPPSLKSTQQQHDLRIHILQTVKKFCRLKQEKKIN